MKPLGHFAITLLGSMYLLLSVNLAQASTAYTAEEAYKAGEFETARSIAYPLAESGDPDAQFLMGRMLEEGKAREPNLVEAFRWHRRAAELGHTDAQLYLATGYSNGRGVAINYKEAAKWWRVLALKGVDVAQDQLARNYAKGEGVAKNMVTAYSWFAIATAQGYERSKEMLDLMEKAMMQQDISVAQAMAERCLESRYRDCG